MLPIHTILHPTDFSPRSAYAFQMACCLARDAHARLIVLHVLERPVMVYGGVAMAPPPPPAEDERPTILKRLHQILSPEATIAVEHRLEEGVATAEILRVTQEAGCDLIVMGTHGRTGLGRLLMGSVAEGVLRKAPCPVLTVKAPAARTAPVAGKSEQLATA